MTSGQFCDVLQIILLCWKLSLSINKDNPAFAFPPVSPPNKILPDCFSFGQLVTSYPVSVKGIWDVTMMSWYVFPLLFLLPSSVSFSVSVPCFCFGQLVAFYPLCVNWIWDVDMMMPGFGCKVGLKGASGKASQPILNQIILSFRF